MKIKRTQCDGCGQEAESERPRGWFEIELKVGGDGGIEKIDTCSYECIGRYAQRKAEELNQP